MKMFKKSLSILLALVMALSFMSVAFAARDIQVFVTIEGINKTLYSGKKVLVPLKSTVYDVLAASGIDIVFGENEDGSKYIISIDGETEKSFGETDGWIYYYNGLKTDLTIDQRKVKFDDKIYIYYADPDGVGFQDPIRSDHLEEGYINFYSEEAAIDEETGEEITVEVPVAGAIMVVDGEYTFVTDEEGNVYLPEELLTGVHKYTLDRHSENGCPTIIRTYSGKFGSNPDSGSSSSSDSGLSIIEKIKIFLSYFKERVKAYFINLFNF